MQHFSWWTKPHSLFPRNGFPLLLRRVALLNGGSMFHIVNAGKSGPKKSGQRRPSFGGYGDKSPSKRRSPKSGHVICMRLRESCDSAKQPKSAALLAILPRMIVLIDHMRRPRPHLRIFVGYAKGRCMIIIIIIIVAVAHTCSNYAVCPRLLASLPPPPPP